MQNASSFVDQDMVVKTIVAVFHALSLLLQPALIDLNQAIKIKEIKQKSCFRALCDFFDIFN